jgi:hypothetical protein
MTATLKTTIIQEPSSAVANMTLDTSGGVSIGGYGKLTSDSKILYATPQASELGIIPSIQLYRLNTAYTGSSSTSAQSMFGVGVTLSSSTVYEFEAAILFSKTTSTASHTVSYLFGGTATVNNIAYVTWQMTNGTQSTYNFTDSAVSGAAVTRATATVIHDASTAQNIARYVRVSGVVSINSGGTFIPQYQNSALGPIYTTNINSYFSIYPIGAAGSNTSVGTWA